MKMTFTFVVLSCLADDDRRRKWRRRTTTFNHLTPVTWKPLKPSSQLMTKSDSFLFLGLHFHRGRKIKTTTQSSCRQNCSTDFRVRPPKLVNFSTLFRFQEAISSSSTYYIIDCCLFFSLFNLFVLLHTFLFLFSISG